MVPPPGSRVALGRMTNVESFKYLLNNSDFSCLVAKPSAHFLIPAFPPLILTPSDI